MATSSIHAANVATSLNSELLRRTGSHRRPDRSIPNYQAAGVNRASTCWFDRRLPRPSRQTAAPPQFESSRSASAVLAESRSIDPYITTTASWRTWGSVFRIVGDVPHESRAVCAVSTSTPSTSSAASRYAITPSVEIYGRSSIRPRTSSMNAHVLVARAALTTYVALYC